LEKKSWRRGKKTRENKMQLLSPQTLLRAPFVDGLTEQVGKSLISREEQKREAYFFFLLSLGSA
jgi:hypothetical protein